jgi:hypothetical protein
MGVTNAGFALAADRLGGVSAAALGWLAYGTGSTAFAASQTTLVAESQRAAATVTVTTTTVPNDTLQLTKTFTIATTETIAEAGSFNAASTGSMMTRGLVSPTKSVVSGDTFTYTEKIKNA